MSYLLRMSCVCAAAFFLLHLAMAALVHTIATPTARLATRLQPAAGARLLFCVRLLPVCVATAVVATLCVPSYLRFEQDAAERIGLPCLLLCFFCITIFVASAVRAARALVVLWSIEGEAGRPVFALVGFLRPRLLISDDVRAALSASQMEAAVLHEEAHRRALDNWKRLAMLCAPGLGFASLEASWARLAEWAADDAAVQAEPHRALALAEAMLQVARLYSAMPRTLPISLLVPGQDELSDRIERLLTPDATMPRRPHPLLMRGAIVLGLGLVVIVSMHGATLLSSVHDAMEHLVR